MNCIGERCGDVGSVVVDRLSKLGLFLLKGKGKGFLEVDVMLILEWMM